jgi:hypothetical protein
VHWHVSYATTASANKPRVGEFYDPEGMISTLRDNQDMMQVLIHLFLEHTNYLASQSFCLNKLMRSNRQSMLL